MPALLLDVGCLCDAHTDAALEVMAKAVGEDPPDIWDEHPNPYVRRVVEMISDRGLRRNAGLADELARWVAGREHMTGSARPARPEGAMRRWDPDELTVVQAYLRALPAEQWTLDDWLMLVDYLVQRYLPPADLRTDADWLVTRANLMGRIQAAMAGALLDPANYDLFLTPSAYAEAISALGMTFEQRAALDFGRARCAEHVQGFADAARQRLRNVIVDWQEATFLGDRVKAAEGLQTVLLDQFGSMNRDWRRIAVTEGTENVDQGFVAAQPAGSRIKRVEKYRGACAFCRSIDGRVVTVVDPGKANKDGTTEVWVGKTNVGRSASPRRREGGQLVEREPHEMWWIAAGSMHPHCRGSWVPDEEIPADPEFEAFLAQLDRRGRTGV